MFHALRILAAIGVAANTAALAHAQDPRPQSIIDASNATRDQIAAHPVFDQTLVDSRALIDGGLLRPFYPFGQLRLNGDRIFRSGWSGWSQASTADYFVGSPDWHEIFSISSLHEVEPARWMPRP